MLYRLLASVCIAAVLSACSTPPQHQHEPLRLRVLTYNIHHGRGTDGVIDLQRLADIIKRAGPDLVALQEVDVKTKRSGGVDQATKLAELAGMHGYFAQAMPHRGGRYGNALLSKAPDGLAYGETIALRTPPDHEPRSVAIAEVVPWGDGRPAVVFAGTHLSHESGPTRFFQAHQLNEETVTYYHMNGILAGDFNFTPGSAPYDVLIDAGWVDTAAAFGDPRPTSPADQPRRRIDYVFVRPADRWRVVDVRVLDAPIASDHAPVLVELEYVWP